MCSWVSSGDLVWRVQLNDYDKQHLLLRKDDYHKNQWVNNYLIHYTWQWSMGMVVMMFVLTSHGSLWSGWDPEINVCVAHDSEAKDVSEASVRLCWDLTLLQSVRDGPWCDWFTEKGQSINKLVWEVLGFMNKSDGNRNLLGGEDGHSTKLITEADSCVAPSKVRFLE